MDGSDRRQSQYGPPYQPPTSRRPTPAQSMGPPPSDPYNASSASRSHANLANQPQTRSFMSDYDYTYQQPQFQSQLQYPSSYVQDTTRQSHLSQQPPQQQYGGYVSGSMLPPVAQPQLYENLPQYQQQRQSTAIEVMAGQFGTGNIQYVPHGESSSTVGVPPSAQPYLSSQPEPQSYAPLPYGRPQLQPPFAPRQSDYLSLDQTVTQQTQEEAGVRQAVEEGRRHYEQQILSTFDDIIAGRVTDASNKLLAATQWLVDFIKPLGLHHDDEENHAQRISMWRDLNHAWEALALKQKSITENALRTQQQPVDFLSASAMQTLVDKLIQLCDQAEKFGLVDYEMGIWEEQIIDVFIQCLNLLSQSQSHGTTDDKS